MRVTVVTPSYNQAQFLEATLESVHSQEHEDIEHIVVDGGSTDESPQILERHADRLAHWVSEPDDGQTDALIKGFASATGDICCWLNSDDLFEPWTLREVVAFFEANPEVDFIYGDATWIDREGNLLKEKREHRFSRFVWLHDHNFIPQPSAFWRRDLYDRVGGLDPSFDLAMDADLWIRFAAVSSPVHVPRLWSRMRFYPEQKNTAMRPASLEEIERIRTRYLTGGRVKRIVARLAARSVRIALKATSGGYSLSEFTRGVTGRLSGRNWEESTLGDSSARPQAGGSESPPRG